MASKRIQAFAFTGGGTTSAAVKMDENVITGFFFDASWSTGDVTFSVSPDNVTFYPVFDSDGNAVQLTSCEASTYVAINPGEMAWAGMYLKLVSSVAQTATAIGNAVRTY